MLKQFSAQLNVLGLSPNESKIYLSLLQLGSASVSDIARESGVLRVNVYDAIKRLQIKGLVGAVTRAQKSFFEPAPPEEINRLINERKKELELLQSSIPSLTELFDCEKSRQTVHHYLGQNGLIAAYNRILDVTPVSGSFTSIGSTGAMREYLPLYTKQFVRKVDEKKIQSRILYYDLARSKKPFKNMVVKYLPKEMKLVPMTTYIFEGHVTIINFEPMLAIEIASSQIYKNYKEYADWLWEISND